MRFNNPIPFTEVTHQGAPAARMTAIQALRRSVMSAMLGEKSFYEDGEAIFDRIARLSKEVHPIQLAEIAIETREVAKLRHVPLLMLSVLAETGAGMSDQLVSNTIVRVIRRADEMGEFLAIHAVRKGTSPDKLKKILTKQMKIGLGRAFAKFDAYQLAKYNRDGAVKLRDILFLTHAKPMDEAQAALWKQLVADELVAPDTWEVALSGGADKKEAFTRLISEGKLGYMALLRNLRGMVDAGVDRNLIREAIIARKGAKEVLPFRFTAAARACPQMEPALDEALSAQIEDLPIFEGTTLVLVDVSYSMRAPLSKKSDMCRMDAAATLASVIHGDVRMFSFSDTLIEVPPRRGMAGVDAIIKSQAHNGTALGEAIRQANAIPHDRLIVITDEQANSRVPNPVAEKAYMLNVSSEKNGVGYGKWVHIDGFSENILRFIHAHEAMVEEKAQATEEVA